MEMETKLEEKKSILGEIREYAEALGIAFALAMLIRTGIVQAFKIPSGSMLQTLQIGDHILVNKFIYWFTEPKRGDIIVFKYPRDKERDFIKRVIGLSGEIIEVRNQKVYINGNLIQENYIQHTEPAGRGEDSFPRDNFGPLAIPKDCVFVMGDNRDNSMDSRFWGPLKKDLIRGEAFLVYFSIEPLDSAGLTVPQSIARWFSTLFARIRWGRMGSRISWLDINLIPRPQVLTT